MNKAVVGIACGLVLGLSAISAHATTILAFGDEYYVGMYRPPEPASAEWEAEYINNLIDVAAGDTEVRDLDPTAGVDNYTFDRTGSTLASGDLDPITTATDSLKVDGGSPVGINTTGFTYLIGKYDGPNGGALVWLIIDLDDVTIPGSYDFDGECTGTGKTKTGCDPAYGLSHYTLFGTEGDGDRVPDGGTALTLLGGALVALGALRRKFRA